MSARTLAIESVCSRARSSTEAVEDLVEDITAMITRCIIDQKSRAKSSAIPDAPEEAQLTVLPEPALDLIWRFSMTSYNRESRVIVNPLVVAAERVQIARRQAARPGLIILPRTMPIGEYPIGYYR